MATPRASDPMTRPAAVRRFRIILILFIIGLLASGITAFPLLREVRVLQRVALGNEPRIGTQLPAWITTVKAGLEETYAHYPWIAYGTDWLAFGHFAIAFFFIGAVWRPAESRMILNAGIAACVAVIPIALICGQVRGIPVLWRLIDCSFGILGLLPLIFCRQLLHHIEKDRPVP
jgi:hypothetical protein